MLAGSLSGDFCHFGFSSCFCSVECFIKKRVAVTFKEKAGEVWVQVVVTFQIS